MRTYYEVVGNYVSLESMLRAEINKGLQELTPECVQKFNRMYPKGLAKLKKSELQTAFDQVYRTTLKPHCRKDGKGEES